MLLGVLPRLEWGALRTSAGELGFTGLPVEKPEGEEIGEEVLKGIWEVLVQVCMDFWLEVVGGRGRGGRRGGGEVYMGANIGDRRR